MNTGKKSGPATPPADVSGAKADPFAGLRGEVRLRTAIDDLANQLCKAVDGNFDFAVRSAIEDETLEKLSMLTNFVLDTARRGMSALQSHNESLAELDLAKTVFFSNASHELRTPLTLILGPLEDALRQSPAGLRGEALASAHRNAVRLLKLVNALLDFSRIEAGRLQATFQPTDLAAFTTELAGVFRSAIERAGLRLALDVQTLPEPVYVDRQMWEKIVLNLLSNAFKFTIEGEIRVSLSATATSAEMEVRDTGVGIPPAEVARVFERFHRVEGTQARTHEGFGIGLAMIHELVRLHGGQVSVTSTLGQGSAFKVTLPLGRAHLPSERIASARALGLGPDGTAPYRQEAESWAAPLPGPVTAAPAARAPVHSDSARILLADDNADMREYVGRLLGEHWIVTTVANGAAALESALADPPDLLVSDVMMPVMDGHQLVRALRADPRTSAIPMLMLSARAGEEAMVEGLDSGADDYLIKPFSGRELVSRVRTHLRLSRMRADVATIERVGSLLNSKLDLQVIVQLLTDEATRLCGAQFGAFFYNVEDDAGERYMLYTLAGVPREAFAHFPMPRKTAIFGPTFDGAGIVRIDDVTTDPRYGQSAPFHGMPKGHLPVRAYLAVPVMARSGEVLGGLFFGHKEPGVFTERSERLLGAIANHAAVAIQNAQLYKSERKARAQAESATRAKDEFLAMLGHELRNPLAPIMTALEIMQMVGDRSTEREQGVIRRQLSHVVRLVDDLLDVSRIARGKMELKSEPLELAQIVSKAIEMAGPLLEQRQQRLSVDVKAEGLRVRGDFIRLAQVIANLLTNAAKFTANGGAISITGQREGSEAVLRVRDNGMGIAADNLESIFEAFAQGPQTIERSQGGLGLGLAIARNLVTLHGGSIKACSEGLGQGSEFVVRLPMDETGALPRTQEQSDAPAAPTTADASLRVMIVDDNRDAAQTLAQALMLAGYQARTAADGPAALRLAASFRPQIALLDIGLPAMDGFELAHRLQQLPETRQTRLVALTGYGQDGDRERTLAGGFADHFVKPVDLGRLRQYLHQAAEQLCGT